MQKSLLLAVLGIVLPSFLYKFTTIGVDSIALVGIGWIWFFSSSAFGDSNFFGIYLSDPRILIIPKDWDGFQTVDGLGADIFLRTFFSDILNGNDTISLFGLLFSLCMILGIIGLILLLIDNKQAPILLILSGLLGLFSLLLFNQTATDSILINNTLPIPIGSILLLLAGFFCYSEKK